MFFAHLGLLRIVWKWTVRRRNMPAFQLNLILAFTALNPRLAGGPMWGQVDIVPLFITVAAFSLLFTPGKAKWAFPVFVLAILTKLQMIAFLPVFGALCLRRVRIAWKGIPIALRFACWCCCRSSSPGTPELLSEAYVTSTSMYPYSSLQCSESLDVDAGERLPGHASAFRTFRGWDRNTSRRTPSENRCSACSPFLRSSRRSASATRGSLQMGDLERPRVLCTAPEMHERYILCVVPMSLWLSRAEKKITRGSLPLLCLRRSTSCSSTDSTERIWPWLSALSSASRFSLPSSWDTSLQSESLRLNLCEKLPVRKASAYLILAIVVIAIATVRVRVSRPVSADLHPMAFLFTICSRSRRRRAINHRRSAKRSMNTLLPWATVSIRTASAPMPLPLSFTSCPENADSLHVGYGIDDEANSGDVIFASRVDGEHCLVKAAPFRQKGAGFIAVSGCAAQNHSAWETAGRPGR